MKTLLLLHRQAVKRRGGMCPAQCLHICVYIRHHTHTHIMDWCTCTLFHARFSGCFGCESRWLLCTAGSSKILVIVKMCVKTTSRSMYIYMYVHVCTTGSIRWNTTARQVLTLFNIAALFFFYPVNINFPNGGILDKVYLK